jgi:electron transport complex protein RnfD
MKKTGWIVSPSPFLMTRPTVYRMSLVLGLSLAPQIMLLAFTNDYGALINIAVAVAGSMLAEMCTGITDWKNRFADGTAIISGIITGMLVPSTLSPIVTGIVAFIGILLVKVVFGGHGSYWMNPIAIAVCIAWISQPAAFPQILVTADGFRTVGDAFGALKLDHFSLDAYDQQLTGAINAGLELAGIKLPEGYLTLFCNSPSPIPAFRYNLLTLAASVVLIAMDIIDWIVPAFFLATYGLCAYFLTGLSFGAVFANGDILFALLTSGTLFIAFYVLPEFSTNPRTRIGKMVSGFIAGLIAFLLSGPGGSPVGSVFTVVIVNSVNPLIEHIENRHLSYTGDPV